MPATRFKGPVITGTPDTGDGANTLATVPAVKRLSVSGDAAYPLRYLPPCDIIRVW